MRLTFMPNELEEMRPRNQALSRQVLLELQRKGVEGALLNQLRELGLTPQLKQCLLVQLSGVASQG